MALNVLMLGWELPPFNSGGLGEACLGLAKALSAKGVVITFVLPRKLPLKFDFMNVVFADIDESFLKLTPSYTSSPVWKKLLSEGEVPPDFIRGAMKFAERIEKLAQKYSPDLIHAHDWMTYPAGTLAKESIFKPLVTHVHSTEFDRTGGHSPNSFVYQLEKKGFEKADRVVPVGGFMKKVLIDKYSVNPEKIQVVYNGIDNVKKNLAPALAAFKKLGYKIVLYHGRITLQKGPEYFVRAAKKVSEYLKKAVFVVSGSGDMQDQMISEAGSLGLLDKFIFTGALWGDERDQIYQAADIYVMPSVSEPFGIVALEAIVNGAPVLISKQSGVSEILRNALKVDFWDVDEMANKIISVLKYGALRRDLRSESAKEITNFSWAKSADKVLEVYNQLIY